MQDKVYKVACSSAAGLLVTALQGENKNTEGGWDVWGRASVALHGRGTLRRYLSSGTRGEVKSGHLSCFMPHAPLVLTTADVRVFRPYSLQGKCD